MHFLYSPQKVKICSLLSSIITQFVLFSASHKLPSAARVMCLSAACTHNSRHHTRNMRCYMLLVSQHTPHWCATLYQREQMNPFIESFYLLDITMLCAPQQIATAPFLSCVLDYLSTAMWLQPQSLTAHGFDQQRPPYSTKRVSHGTRRIDVRKGWKPLQKQNK